MTEPEIRDAHPMSLEEPSIYRSETINVFVSPDEFRYYVHKEKLCSASLFFQGCFQLSMKESTSNTIKLPEDDPNDFGVIVDYIYDRVIFTRAKNGRNHVARLICGYLLGDKLCMEACANAIMDKTQQWRTMFFSFPLMLEGLSECKMRAFLLAQVAWDMRVHIGGGRGISEEGNDPDNARRLVEDVSQFFIRGGELVAQVMSISRQSRMEHNQVWEHDSWSSDGSPARMGSCENYHLHTHTSPCNGWALSSPATDRASSNLIARGKDSPLVP